MLTKNDLDQIRKVVRQEVKVEIKDSTRTLDSQIRLSRMQVQANIGELDDRMKNVEIRLDDVGSQVTKAQKDITDTNKRVRKIENTVSVLVNRTDREETNLGKRITRLEENAGFPTPQ